MENHDPARIVPYGDSALLVEFDDRIDRETSNQILALKAKIDRKSFLGVTETVPTFRSLLVRYDPLVTDFAKIADVLASLKAEAAPNGGKGRHWQVPVCYEPDYAPDLGDVAQALDLAPDEVLSRHLEVCYHVYMIGFVAGYPYLGDLPENLSLPRRADPRLRVPAGSIAIALTMAAIYPVVSPGGWHLIGRTPIKLFDPNWADPALFAPGDKITFTPISAAEFGEIEQATMLDGFKLDPRAAQR